jgi:hypothetical protein
MISGMGASIIFIFLGNTPMLPNFDFNVYLIYLFKT